MCEERMSLVSSWKGLAGDLQCGGVVGVSMLGLPNARQHVSGPLGVHVMACT